MNANAWKKRHEEARAFPGGGFERGLCGMIDALAAYADAHAARYHAPIAHDYVLGDAWLEALQAVNQLLNGELGRLDGGSLSSEIEALARRAGFESGTEGRAG